MDIAEELVVDARKFSRAPKASIHKSGRIGFNGDATVELNLSTKARLMLFKRQDNDSYLMAIVNEGEDGGKGFKLQSTGLYYSANLKMFFDEEKVDYANPMTTIIYDLVKTADTFKGVPVYEMKQRVVIRRGKRPSESI